MGRCPRLNQVAPLRISDAEILIIAGLGDSGPGHWQARWLAKLSTARRVDMVSWEKPVLGQWRQAIIDAVERAQKPVVCVAHSLGCIALAHAAPALGAGKVRGALMVTPPSDESIEAVPVIDPGFAPCPRAPLAFPALIVASRSDPHADYDATAALAAALGARLTDAGHSGHINAESGHGPWPEGLLSFAGFMRGL